jgi:hypothetical protein
MLPEVPDVDDPVARDTHPLVPFTESPLATVTLPESPLDVASAVRTKMLPDAELRLLPDDNVNAPPVPPKLLPATKRTAPPAPLPLFVAPALITTAPAAEKPAPTTREMSPPRPDVAVPLLTKIQPELPRPPKPDTRLTDPDAPLDMTSADDTCTAPEPLLVLWPLVSSTVPPVPFDLEAPPSTTIPLPTPERLVATMMLTEPDRPSVADPDDNRTKPLFPDTLPPVCIDSAPEMPEDDTDADDTTTEPEPELKLLPLVTIIEPPTPPPEVQPAVNDTAPPEPPADDAAPATNSSARPSPDCASPTIKLMEPATPAVAEPVETWK